LKIDTVSRSCKLDRLVGTSCDFPKRTETRFSSQLVCIRLPSRLHQDGFMERFGCCTLPIESVRYLQSGSNQDTYPTADHFCLVIILIKYSFCKKIERNKYIYILSIQFTCCFQNSAKTELAS
jgi:hypothetical protein